MMFQKGQQVSWLHGEHHRVAVVIEVENERVRLSGLTSDYWINAETLKAKINRPYPIRQRG